MQQVESLALECLASLRRGGKIIFAGNGGSFADAQHLSAEFTSRFAFDHAPLASIALGTNNSAISAIGNDYGYEQVFARELLAVAKPEDVFIAISTSGNSANVVVAVEQALQVGVKTIVLTGQTGANSKTCVTAYACPPLKPHASKSAIFCWATFCVVWWKSSIFQSR